MSMRFIRRDKTIVKLDTWWNDVKDDYEKYGTTTLYIHAFEPPTHLDGRITFVDPHYPHYIYINIPRWMTPYAYEDRFKKGTKVEIRGSCNDFPLLYIEDLRIPLLIKGKILSVKDIPQLTFDHHDLFQLLPTARPYMIMKTSDWKGEEGWELYLELTTEKGFFDIRIYDISIYHLAPVLSESFPELKDKVFERDEDVLEFLRGYFYEWREMIFIRDRKYGLLTFDRDW